MPDQPADPQTNQKKTVAERFAAPPAPVPASRRKAEALLVEPLDWDNAPIAQVIADLQLLIALACEAAEPGNLPVGIPLVYADGAQLPAQSVTMTGWETPIALSTLLTLIAAQAHLEVSYHETGIVLAAPEVRQVLGGPPVLSVGSNGTASGGPPLPLLRDPKLLRHHLREVKLPSFQIRELEPDQALFVIRWTYQEFAAKARLEPVDLPLVYLGASKNLRVTVRYPFPVSVSLVLEDIAEQTGTMTNYTSTAIVFEPSAFNLDCPVAYESAQQPILSTACEPCTSWKMLSLEEQGLRFKEAQRRIKERYPAIAKEGSAAQSAFLNAFSAISASAADAMPIADLVMIYPPKS